MISVYRVANKKYISFEKYEKKVRIIENLCKIGYKPRRCFCFPSLFPGRQNFLFSNF
jgi:hypothetical protein